MYRPFCEELEARDCPSASPAQITAITGNAKLTQGQMVVQLQNLGLSTRQVYEAIWEPNANPQTGNPSPVTVVWAPNEPAGTDTTGPIYTAPPGGPWVLSVDQNGVASWQAAPPNPGVFDGMTSDQMNARMVADQQVMLATMQQATANIQAQVAFFANVVAPQQQADLAQQAALQAANEQLFAAAKASTPTVGDGSNTLITLPDGAQISTYLPPITNAPLTPVAAGTAVLPPIATFVPPVGVVFPTAPTANPFAGDDVVSSQSLDAVSPVQDVFTPLTPTAQPVVQSSPPVTMQAVDAVFAVTDPLQLLDPLAI